MTETTERKDGNVYIYVNTSGAEREISSEETQRTMATDGATERNLAELATKALPPIIGLPIGTILAYGGLVSGSSQGDLARAGWLVCNGDAISRNDYAELFNVIGNMFGSGNYVSTFNLPDLRGRFVRGVDNGAGRDPDAKSRTASSSGGNTGDNVGSVQEDEFKKHNHLLPNIPKDTGGKYGAPMGGSGLGITWPGYNGTPTPVSDDVGGSETRPKNIYLNYIIKAKNL